MITISPQLSRSSSIASDHFLSASRRSSDNLSLISSMSDTSDLRRRTSQSSVDSFSSTTHLLKPESFDQESPLDNTPTRNRNYINFWDKLTQNPAIKKTLEVLVNRVQSSFNSMRSSINDRGINLNRLGFNFNHAYTQLEKSPRHYLSMCSDAVKKINKENITTFAKTAAHTLQNIAEKVPIVIVGIAIVPICIAMLVPAAIGMIMKEVKTNNNKQLNNQHELVA